MITETTTNLPPCPLTDCEVGEHHYHDIDAYAIGEGHDCVSEKNLGYRCYGPHQPQQIWQPIEHDQIKAGMRIRATVAWGDCVISRTGVAHHEGRDGDWYTEGDRMLAGWSNSVTYEVDPAIPDPDADLIEKLAELLDLTNPEDAREVIAAVRARVQSSS